MEHKILRTKNPISGNYTYIAAVVETENAAYWSGYYMILTQAFKIKHPITHYTLESNRIISKLEDALRKQSFITQVVDHAKCAFEVNFYEENKEKYTEIIMNRNGIEFIESQDEDAFNSVILNCSEEQMPIVEKFVNTAYSEDLALKIRMAQKLRRSLKIETID